MIQLPPPSSARKQKKRRSEDVSPTPIPNQKTKNSFFEKCVSIVKSIDMLVKTIATDETNNKQASAASAAAFSLGVAPEIIPLPVSQSRSEFTAD